MFRIMFLMNISRPIKEMLEPGREAGAEEEGGERDILVALSQGRGLEETLVDTLVTTKSIGPLMQVCLQGLDQLVQTGEEMKKTVQNKPVRSRILKLKSPGNLTRSTEDSTTVKKRTMLKMGGQS